MEENGSNGYSPQNNGSGCKTTQQDALKPENECETSVSEQAEEQLRLETNASITTTRKGLPRYDHGYDPEVATEVEYRREEYMCDDLGRCQPVPVYPTKNGIDESWLYEHFICKRYSECTISG